MRCRDVAARDLLSLLCSAAEPSIAMQQSNHHSADRATPSQARLPHPAPRSECWRQLGQADRYFVKSIIFALSHCSLLMVL